MITKQKIATSGRKRKERVAILRRQSTPWDQMLRPSLGDAWPTGLTATVRHAKREYVPARAHSETVLFLHGAVVTKFMTSGAREEGVEVVLCISSELCDLGRRRVTLGLSSPPPTPDRPLAVRETHHAAQPLEMPAHAVP